MGALGAVLVLIVALKDFALGDEPVFVFVAGDEAAALGQQIGELTNFILNIDGHQFG